MEIIEGPVVVETLQETTLPPSQPAPVAFSDAAVREAIASAELKGVNPESLKVSDLSQGSIPTQTPPAAQAPKEEVPAKFLKPDGEVDVEKLQASTRQLDEVLKEKETEIQKSVDDYVREYKVKEEKFRNLPNPDKLADALPRAPVPESPLPMNDEQFKARIMADMQRDFVGTMTDLTSVIVERALADKIRPIEQDVLQTREERKETALRNNINEIAKRDPRVLTPKVFDAINAKLNADPDLWRLKNPHKAAWLEVKEELRLGEPSMVQAHPSRAPTPILGGGTPASTPSSSDRLPQNIIASLDKLDLKDKKQEAAGDAAVRAMLQGR